MSDVKILTAAQRKAIASALSRVEKIQRAIGAERDKLREVYSHIEEIISDVDEADDNLNGAIDALSRLQ